MADNEKKGSLSSAYWDDLRAPAAAINPPGAESDPDRDAASGWLLFDKALTELIYVTYQMPHGYIEGTDIRFHAHYHKTTSAAGTVAWRMRYRYANIGETWSAWSDPETVTVPTVSDANTAELQALVSFTPISIPSSRISMNLLIELARVGSGDTYDADVALSDADCHIQLNQPGSVQLFKKYSDDRQYE